MRIAWVLVLLAACSNEAPGSRLLTAGEYHWGPAAPDATWTAVELDTIYSEPPGRTGDELWVRVPLPKVEARSPAVALRFAFGLRSVQVGGRELHDPEQVWNVFPLPPEYSGEHLVQRYLSPRRVVVGDVWVGEHSELLDATTQREMRGFVVGAALAVLALIVGLACLRRRPPPELPPFALFSGALALVLLAEAFQLRIALFPWPEAWRVLHPVGVFLAPLGLLLFVRAVFGDTRRRVLAILAATLAISFAVAIGVHLLGVRSLADAKPVPAALSLVTLAAVVRVVAPFARRGDAKARIFLLGWAAFGLLVLPSLLSAMRWSVPFTTLNLAMLALVLSLAVVVVQKHRDNEDDLARRLAALEQKHLEVATLNSELRRQVAERSRELASAAETSLGSSGGSQGLAPGTVFDGRYRVVRKLGQGGMGAVYEVARLADGLGFALKVMSSRAGLEAARFFREAEIAARLSHPNLVSVTDVGVSSGTLYLVMELVAGVSLESCRARFGEVGWALSILGQLAGGLAALHAVEVVHRDLKPANVLLAGETGENWRVKIADFGLSRQGVAAIVDSGDTLPPGASADSPRPGAQLTASGVIMGTPPYMAPELATGARDAAASSDVFAFGVTAYEVLCGTRPFATAPIYDVLAGRTVPRPIPLRSRIELPAALARLFETCLAPDPAVRPSAATLAEALAAPR